MRRAPLAHFSAPSSPVAPAPLGVDLGAEAQPGPSCDDAPMTPRLGGGAGPAFDQELQDYLARKAAVDEIATTVREALNGFEIGVAVLAVALIIRGCWPAIVAFVAGLA